MNISFFFISLFDGSLTKVFDLEKLVGDQCFEYYEIDPCYTYSTPGSTWIFGMIYTGVYLKYLKKETVNIFDTIQKGVRGGLALVLGYCHVKCRIKQTESEYTGKKLFKIF